MYPINFDQSPKKHPTSTIQRFSSQSPSGGKKNHSKFLFGWILGIISIGTKIILRSYINIFSENRWWLASFQKLFVNIGCGGAKPILLFSCRIFGTSLCVSSSWTILNISDYMKFDIFTDKKYQTLDPERHFIWSGENMLARWDVKK